MKRFSLKFFLTLLFCLLYNEICSAQDQWQQIGEDGLVATKAMEQSLTFDHENTPFIAYHDKANSSRAVVKKFDGRSWNLIGEPGISVGYAKGISLILDNRGTPYISYVDIGINAKAVVKKFNGRNWVNVGSAYFSVDYAAGISLALDSNGNPYIAYQNKDKEGKAVVKKFNGSNWINVGPANFTRSYANNISLVLDGNDVPYISFIDEGFGGKASVKKFNGRKWEDLSSNGLTNNYATGLSLAFDGEATPYLLFRDETANYKATVKKYKNNGWVDVGSAGFSDGKVSHTKLIVADNGTPYVAYVDFGNGAIDNVGTTEVKKFNGSSWEDISPVNIKTINNLENDYDHILALDNDGQPFLTYSNKGRSSRIAALKLTSTVVLNKRPVAEAGNDKTITLPVKSLQLSGLGSDEDGTISSYTWKQISGPNQAKFSNLKTASPVISGLKAGIYEFSLTTKDNKNASSLADLVTIIVLENEAPVQKITSFILIDAVTKKDLQKITDGATINLASLSTKKLSIKAITNLEVGSVVFELNGEENKDRVENSSPYYLIASNDYWTPTIGDYTLKATPFEMSDGKGIDGIDLDVSFSIIDDDSNSDSGTGFPKEQKVVSFTLINADNNKDIETIDNGTTINLANLPTKNIAIRVNTNTEVGSVEMKLSGKRTRNVIENFEPYALFGGSNNNYKPWNPVDGNYTLEATPYSLRFGRGSAGNSLSINFNIIDQLTSPAATATARKKQKAEEITDFNNSISVYPNPATNKLYIKVSNAGEGVSNINLLDASGRKVLTKQSNITSNLITELDIDQFHPGVYILVVTSPQGRLSRRVVIK